MKIQKESVVTSKLHPESDEFGWVTTTEANQVINFEDTVRHRKYTLDSIEIETGGEGGVSLAINSDWDNIITMEANEFKSISGPISHMVVIADESTLKFEGTSNFYTKGPEVAISFGRDDDDEVTISLDSSDDQFKIYYTLDNSDPDSDSTEYTGAFIISDITDEAIDDGGTLTLFVKAIAYDLDNDPGPIEILSEVV